MTTGRYGLAIRGADTGDLPGLASLLATAGIVDDAATLAARVDAIGQAGGTVLLAHEWGPPSGAVAVAIARTLRDAAPVGLVTFLLVAPDARRRGVGRLLVKAAAQFARNARCARLALLGGAGGDEAEELDAFRRAAGFGIEGGGWSRPLRKRG